MTKQEEIKLIADSCMIDVYNQKDSLVMIIYGEADIRKEHPSIVIYDPSTNANQLLEAIEIQAKMDKNAELIDFLNWIINQQSIDEPIPEKIQPFLYQALVKHCEATMNIKHNENNNCIMKTTILEALQNVDANLDNLKIVGLEILPIIKLQLNNVIALLERGYSIYDEVEPLLEKFKDVESIPEKP